MDLSRELWQANQDLAKACLHSPFVQGLARGTLPHHKFAYYVGQDAFFLETFARAYTVAAAKSPNWYGFETFHTLAHGALQELRLHQQYADRWRINLTEVQPGLATRRYVEFLMNTAWEESVGMTAIAMAPCMRLYAFLGQTLAKHDLPKHDYLEWIETYSDETFESLAQTLEDLVDRYAPEDPKLYSVYRYAMLCERDFFQMAWEWGDMDEQPGYALLS
ncbi:MAG: TenA family protein [Synechococcales bacterium]|nr:TenA family protein [Synechococcales bacterium]